MKFKECGQWEIGTLRLYFLFPFLILEESEEDGESEVFKQ